MTGLDFRMKIKLGPKAKWNKNFLQELAAFKAPEFLRYIWCIYGDPIYFRIFGSMHDGLVSLHVISFVS